MPIFFHTQPECHVFFEWPSEQVGPLKETKFVFTAKDIEHDESCKIPEKFEKNWA